MKASKFKIPLPHPLILLSAILIVISFAPFNLYFFIWVALAPYFYRLMTTKDLRTIVIDALWLAFLMTMGGFYWMVHVIHQFGDIPWILSGILVLLFGFVCQPQFVAFSILFYTLRKYQRIPTRGLPLLWWALAYTAIDYFLPKLWQDSMGNSLYLAVYLRQVADLGGVRLLTFLIVFFNLGFADFLAHRQKLTAGLASIFVLAAWIYGYERSAEIETLIRDSANRVHAGVIQGDVGDFEKLEAEMGRGQQADRVVRKYLTLSEMVLRKTPRPDFLVWPETAYPSLFRNPRSASDLRREQAIEEFVKSRKVPLLFGAYDVDTKTNKEFNSLFVLTPKSYRHLPGEGDLQIYHKNILLMFGEEMPGAETFEWINDAFPQVGNFGRGPGPTVIEVPLESEANPLSLIKVSPIICYEALIPKYVIEGAKLGSQLILNITNDSWFGPYGEPYLHLSLTVFRSIETRLPQLRSTNSGISTLILPNGDIAAPSNLFEPQALHYTVPIISPQSTLMMEWGDWFGPFTLIASLLSLLVKFLSQLPKRKHAKHS